MSKWIVLSMLVFILGFGFLYFMTSSVVSVKAKMPCGGNVKAFSRNLFDESKWQQWWPVKLKETLQPPGQFNYNGNVYRILEKRLSSLLLSVKKGQDSIQTELTLLPLAGDSMELNWLGVVRTGTNPFDRVKRNDWAKALSTDLQTLLQKFCFYYSNATHIYGFRIQGERVVDSTLIFTSAESRVYPNTESIYNLIDKLKTFAQKHGARQTGSPMLNINIGDDSIYQTKVALPVDRKLKNEGDVKYRWMLGGGNILAAEVKGGLSQINNAFAAMETYIEDYGRVAPAVPFQSLVTDRRNEPDSAKWITKIYWPVM